MTGLEAWHAAIDNIPDNLFIKNPFQRKNALKEKFEEVFEEISEAQEELAEGSESDDADESEDEEEDDEEIVEAYEDAIEKLEHDILKKLDGDGKADWVREPTLVDELRAFIGMLRRAAGNGED